MKLYILGAISCLFSATPSFAVENSYDLKMKLSLNGIHVSSPQLIVKEGETGSIVQKSNGKSTFIDVTATEGTIQNHEGIFMKFVVGTINKDGEKTLAGTPQILALENEEATIGAGGKYGEETLKLSVIVQRKKL